MRRTSSFSDGITFAREGLDVPDVSHVVNYSLGLSVGAAGSKRCQPQRGPQVDGSIFPLTKPGAFG